MKKDKAVQSIIKFIIFINFWQEKQKNKTNMQYTIVMPNYTRVCQTLPFVIVAVFGNPIISLREW